MKIVLNKYFFFLFFFIGLISCTKEKGTEIIRVRGMVLDVNSNAPVPNQVLNLKEEGIKQQVPFNASSASNEILLRKQTTSDIHGYFDFGLIEIKKSSKYEYYVDFEDKNDNKKNINKGMDNFMFLKSEGHAYFQVNLIPLPPYPVNDSLVVLFTNAKYPYIGSKITNINYMQYYYLTPQFANTGYWYVNIQKYKAGVYTVESDTVLYLNGNTYTYDVNF